MENQFALEKQNALTKTDKSHEQKWDKKIVALCNKINESPNYFTTSSCAGRITLIKNSSKKVPNIFLYKTHTKTKKEEIQKPINTENQTIYFRQEPCALHVACKSLEDAINLLKLAKQAGWKRSGIFSSNKSKFICELTSTEWIVAPLVINNELLVDKKYIEILVEEANIKLEKTWEKIERLEKMITHL